jgi:hypothetical protein
MEKAEQFLWAVQTIVVANAVHLAVNSARSEAPPKTLAPTELGFVLEEALRASQRLPNDKTASDAAVEFCVFMLENLRTDEAATTGKRMIAPAWFAND